MNPVHKHSKRAELTTTASMPPLLTTTTHTNSPRWHSSASASVPFGEAWLDQTSTNLEGGTSSRCVVCTDSRMGKAMRAFASNADLITIDGRVRGVST